MGVRKTHRAMSRMDWALYYAARCAKGDNEQASHLCWWYLLLNEAQQGE